LTQNLGPKCARASFKTLMSVRYNNNIILYSLKHGHLYEQNLYTSHGVLD
jgi:hypothetical protein